MKYAKVIISPAGQLLKLNAKTNKWEDAPESMRHLAVPFGHPYKIIGKV